MIPRKITFSHIFFGKEERGGWAEAERSAKHVSTQLLAVSPDNDNEINIGDRFFFTRIMWRNLFEHISSHFGKQFSDAVFKLGLERWEGPIKSAYGYHIVFVSEIFEERFQDLEEIYDRGRVDAKQAAITELTETFILDLKKNIK